MVGIIVQTIPVSYTHLDVYKRQEYMNIILASGIENPVLIDKYMMGIEVEVDAICDGTDYLIPGIMEHIERAGIHSGDSISVYPAQRLTEENKKTIVEYTGRLARELHVIGLMNIQYVVHNGEVYVIEVNPRSSRTVPYISKVTNVPMVDLATKIMLGATLKGMGYETGVHPVGDYVEMCIRDRLTDISYTFSVKKTRTNYIPWFLSEIYICVMSTSSTS